MAGLLSCLKFVRALPCNRARRGSFAPEFALLAPVFFLLLMGLVELGLIEGAQQLLENAAFNASRLGKTGYVTQGQTQAQTVNAIVVQELSSFGNFFNTLNVTVTESVYNSFSGAQGGGGTSGYGGEQQIVVYTITYPWKVFTPLMCSALGSACYTNTNGSFINLNSSIVVRNEPYG